MTTRCVRHNTRWFHHIPLGGNFPEPLLLDGVELSTDNSLQVVDWHQGKVVTGGEESEILKMLNAIPKDK